MSSHDPAMPICDRCHAPTDGQVTRCQSCRAKPSRAFRVALLRLTTHPDTTLARLAAGIVKRLAALNLL